METKIREMYVKYVTSDVDLDLNDDDTVSRLQPVLYPWYFFSF